MKRKIYLALGLLLGLGMTEMANAQQKIGSDPGNLNPGAILELASSNRGFLPPRLSLTATNVWGLNGTATNGMIVYNNATAGTGATAVTPGFYVWQGSWQRVATGSTEITNALDYNAATRVLTSTINGVAASTAALPLATGSATGLLSSADFATFNAKENPLTFSNGLTRTANAITLGGALTGATSLTLGANNFTFGGATTGKVIVSGPSGSSTSGLQLSNLLTAVTPSAASAGQRILTVDGSGNVILGTDFGTSNAGTVTSVTGTAPINVATGTTTPVISINALGITSGLIADGAVTLGKIAPSGTAGQVLTSSGAGAAPTWTTLPSATNLYNADGTLSSARTVTQGANNLTFTGTGGLFKLSGSAASPTVFTLGRTGAEAEIGIAAASGQGFTSASTGDFWLKNNGGGNLLLGTTGADDFRVLTNNSLRMTVGATGNVIFNSLAGTGSRMVVADAAGQLGTQAIPAAQTLSLAGSTLSISGGNSVTLPSSSNIYNADGTLTGARTVTMGTNNLMFSGAGTLQKMSGSAATNSIFQMGRTSNELELGVASGANMGFNGTAAGDIWFRNLANLGDIFMGTAQSGRIKFITKNTERMTVDTLGNVGIGVGNPNVRLAINGGTNTSGVPQVAENLLSLYRPGTGGVSFGSGAAIGIGKYSTSNNSSTNMVFRLANLQESDLRDVMTLQANGLVGIGTTTPSAQLHTTGTVRFQGAGTPGVGKILTSDANGNATWEAAPSAQTLTLTGSTLSISGGNSVTLPAATNLYNANGTLSGDRVVTQGANTLTFTGSGNFNKLSGNDSDFTRYTLGRTVSESEWGVVGNPGGGFPLSDAGDVWFRTNLAGSNLMLGTKLSADVKLFTNDTQRMTVLGSNGYVGIGTTTPTSTLDVNGSVSNAILKVSSATTLNQTHHTVIANAFTAGFAITLPAPSTASGRVYVIRKVDESSNAITFTFAGITGTNAIRVSDTSASAGSYINSLNYVKTLRIQSDGTDWYLID